MHPPADRRCQIYVQRGGAGDLFRCANPGTHWEKWGGCDCEQPFHEDVCEQTHFSWECDGHGPFQAGEAA